MIYLVGVVAGVITFDAVLSLVSAFAVLIAGVVAKFGIDALDDGVRRWKRTPRDPR